MAAYFFGITDKGKRRDNNEDTFIVQEMTGSSLLLACVIDGVGGYNGGEVAAEIARTVIIEKLQHISGDIVERLRTAVGEANSRIQEERNSEKANANMACVLTCVITDKKNNKLWYAHVGDTRLYLLRDDSLVKISSDHSAVGFLEESGRLSEFEAMHHPRRNEIDRALGFDTAIAESEDYIETGESPFLPGDTILLCSDGLSDMIGSDEISSIINKDKTISERAKELVEAANKAGGNDNITAVIIENNRQPKKQQALKPVVKINAAQRTPPANKNSAQHRSISKNKGKRAMVIGAGLFLLVVLIVAFVQRKQLRQDVVITNTQPVKDAKLVQFINAAHDSSKGYSLPVGSSLIINESIRIDKDSFRLRGNGTHLTADTGYEGPALTISKNAKHIFLDSMVFENFDAALFIQKSNVEFRNVRFINCRIPVQYGAAFADTLISGRFIDSIFINNKSLKK